ncbi:MAG: YggT family protein [Actinomycetota bacterium]|nr:YggT family protein [Actinomycetota bacterium]
MNIICIALWVYTIILLVRIVLSWVTMAWSPPPSMAPAVRVVYDLTEPVLSLFRRYIPPMGGFDLSPIIIFILIGLVRSYVCV